jgi:hypothetical protein
MLLHSYVATKAYTNQDNSVVKDSAVLASCHRCNEYLTGSFEFLPTWWEPAFHEINGYFGCEDKLDKDGEIAAVGTYTLLSYTLYCSQYSYQKLGLDS